MRSYLFAAAAAVALATPAFATPPEHAGNPHGGDATAVGVGVGAAEANAAAVALSGAVAVNGPNTATAVNGPNTNLNTVNAGDNRATVGNVSATGGAGGAGGRADSSSTLIAPVTSTNTNANLQGQKQTNVGINGQDQSQGQAQDQAQRQGQDQSQTATAQQRQELSGNNSGATSSSAGQTNDQNVVVEGDEAQRRNPVSSAYAAPLSIGGGVCAYTPVSAAGQFVSFGISGSAAKIDQGCETRATADMFARLGMSYEACLIMVGQGPAMRAGLTSSACVRPAIPAPAAVVVVPPHAPVTMQPIPDGERGGY